MLHSDFVKARDKPILQVTTLSDLRRHRFLLSGFGLFSCSVPHLKIKVETLGWKWFWWRNCILFWVCCFSIWSWFLDSGFELVFFGLVWKLKWFKFWFALIFDALVWKHELGSDELTNLEFDGCWLCFTLFCWSSNAVSLLLLLAFLLMIGMIKHWRI